jgi:hypothetical protein
MQQLNTFVDKSLWASINLKLAELPQLLDGDMRAKYVTQGRQTAFKELSSILQAIEKEGRMRLCGKREQRAFCRAQTLDPTGPHFQGGRGGERNT